MKKPETEVERLKRLLSSANRRVRGSRLALADAADLCARMTADRDRHRSVSREAQTAFLEVTMRLNAERCGLEMEIIDGLDDLPFETRHDENVVFGSARTAQLCASLEAVFGRFAVSADRADAQMPAEGLVVAFAFEDSADAVAFKMSLS